jgi:hypothetical protein
MKLKILSSKKRGVKRGTYQFASTSYTIADVFGTLKRLLSWFEIWKNRLQRLGPNKGGVFLCRLSYQNLICTLRLCAAAPCDDTPTAATVAIAISGVSLLIGKNILSLLSVLHRLVYEEIWQNMFIFCVLHSFVVHGTVHIFSVKVNSLE